MRSRTSESGCSSRTPSGARAWERTELGGRVQDEHRADLPLRGPREGRDERSETKPGRGSRIVAQDEDVARECLARDGAFWQCEGDGRTGTGPAGAVNQGRGRVLPCRPVQEPQGRGKLRRDRPVNLEEPSIDVFETLPIALGDCGVHRLAESVGKHLKAGRRGPSGFLGGAHAESFENIPVRCLSRGLPRDMRTFEHPVDQAPDHPVVRPGELVVEGGGYLGVDVAVPVHRGTMEAEGRGGFRYSLVAERDEERRCA